MRSAKGWISRPRRRVMLWIGRIFVSAAIPYLLILTAAHSQHAADVDLQLVVVVAVVRTDNLSL